MMSHSETRKRLPATRTGVTRKAAACGFEYYVTVNFYENNGHPGEVFITIAKEGSDLAGLFDALAVTISIALQYGVPWDVMREKYLHTRFGSEDERNTSILHGIAMSIDDMVSEMRLTKERTP